MRWLFAYMKAWVFDAKPDAPTPQNEKKPAASPPQGKMSEGDIHSGPGGYEGGSYSDGYAADYRNGEH